MGRLPPCAICMGPGSGGRQIVHLAHGISVWLCVEHRSDEFFRSRAGRDVVVSLWRMWEAAGCLTASRRRVLDALLARAVEAPRAAGRPGSYSWPTLRRQLLRRVAAGEPPAPAIAALRERHSGGTARVPTARTMQRWLREGLDADADGGAEPGPARPRRSPAPGRPGPGGA